MTFPVTNYSHLPTRRCCVVDAWIEEGTLPSPFPFNLYIRPSGSGAAVQPALLRDYCYPIPIIVNQPVCHYGVCGLNRTAALAVVGTCWLVPARGYAMVRLITHSIILPHAAAFDAA